MTSKGSARAQALFAIIQLNRNCQMVCSRAKCTGRPPLLHNYPIKSALMSSLSPCLEASPHSVCKVRVPSLPQFDSVKAWKQIKGCCFSQSWRDTEPVRTRLTRGSFATRCFCLWWGLRNVGTSPRLPFCSLFFARSLQWVIYEKDQEEHEIL